MAFDQTTRNRLQRFVADARSLLTVGFTHQMQNEYGLDPATGSVSPIEALHLDDSRLETARILRDTLDHYRKGSASTDDKQLLKQITREQAFTVLNRFAALKMAEARGILIESLDKGYESQGFQLYQKIAGTGLGETGDAYKAYLFSIFDEFAVDLKVLFDRFSPTGLLFPKETVMLELVALVNDPEIDPLWAEDETIGWIYQYFNTKEERKKMRDESAAPRNSRELAVRNQFFTPRYVVEFLTDNTLGRTWYEMTRGRTSLAESCRYLVRRPKEIFLGDLEAAAKHFGTDVKESGIPDSVRAAFQGDFANAFEEQIGSNRWWVGLAIPPDQYEKITGTPLQQLDDYPHVGDVWDALDGTNTSEHLLETDSLLAAFSQFILTSSGGPYAVEPTERLWNAIKESLERESSENESQGALLQRPVYIPHRPIKDPREILMLDPACGSMHFGLYAFDLFLKIYEEAWELSIVPSSAGGFKPLRETYDNDKERFLLDIPRLIIENNIHGVDIDPRAVQIAGLSLWLRAQRAWAEHNVRPHDRPQIRRSNIVCAEPMPGEAELLEEFIEKHFANTAEKRLLGEFVRRIFESMQLAGEAGSLLKIEEEVAELISESREQWRKLQQTGDEKPVLFDYAPVDPQQSLDLQVGEITDANFWDRGESEIYKALRRYSEASENGAGYQRRLFADDAAQGFAFIDICRKKYDAVLMNPPFGDASLPSKPYLDETYGDTKGDVYKAFVECFHARLVPAGYLGIISSRTGFFLGQSEDWRTRVVLRLFRPIALADLGMGVLDAMVEVAAYVLRSLSAPEARDLTLSIVPVLEKVVRDSQDRFSLPKWQAARGGLKRHQAVAELEHLEIHGFVQRSPGDTVRYTPLWHSVKKVTAPPEPVFPPFVCVRALAEEDKGAVLAAAVARDTDPQKFVCDPAGFASMPGSPFAYWSSTSIRTLGQRLPHYEPVVGSVKVGVQTDDDFRFVRAWWEVICRRETDSISAEWTPFLKGDSASPFHDDIATVLSWANEGRELKQFVTQVLNGGHWSRHVFNSEFYFRPGISWALRTARFAPSCVPKGCIPSVSRYLAVSDRYSTLAVVGLWNSSVHDALCKLRMERHGHPKFIVGVVKATPFPLLSSEDEVRLEELSRSAWSSKRELAAAHSTSHAFVLPALLATASSTLADRAEVWAARVRMSEKSVAAIRAEIDELAFRVYGLEAADRAALTTAISADSIDEIPADVGEIEEEEVATADATALTADLLAYSLGVAFGRWDIRYATGEQAAPELPDPFAPLPVCPPGQLQNAQGLPARPEDVPAAYPVRIPWDGILVDDPNHPLDVERRVREVIEIIWSGKEGGPTAEAIEQEACEILSVRSLRDYFRKPTGFFADHLKRYSKSRRQAPIYLPLSTKSGEYTLWLYYHRLTDQTLFSCINDFVEPKIRQTKDDVNGLSSKLGRSSNDEKRLEQLTDLSFELEELRDELLRLASTWKPNLNDGVQITMSPLWKLFRLPKWRKTLEDTWKKLEKGEYDWAHLAYSLWPDRVREKCKKDKSLAIAHDLEDLYEEPPATKKKGKKPAADLYETGIV